MCMVFLIGMKTSVFFVSVCFIKFSNKFEKWSCSGIFCKVF